MTMQHLATRSTNKICISFTSRERMFFWETLRPTFYVSGLPRMQPIIQWRLENGLGDIKYSWYVCGIDGIIAIGSLNGPWL